MVNNYMIGQKFGKLPHEVYDQLTYYDYKAIKIAGLIERQQEILASNK